MSSVDLEKLKMTGAGRAIAVLTSGGDAQGDKILQNCHEGAVFSLGARVQTCIQVSVKLWNKILYRKLDESFQKPHWTLADFNLQLQLIG